VLSALLAGLARPFTVFGEVAGTAAMALVVARVIALLAIVATAGLALLMAVLAALSAGFAGTLLVLGEVAGTATLFVLVSHWDLLSNGAPHAESTGPAARGSENSSYFRTR
jgi:hypothetical protein